MKDGFFSRQLQPGSPIRPFMVAGMLEKDYTGARDRSAVRECLEQAFAQAVEELNGRVFHEYDTFSLCGMTGRWSCLLYTSRCV